MIRLIVALGFHASVAWLLPGLFSALSAYLTKLALSPFALYSSRSIPIADHRFT